jgi:tRNA 2-thiouridine synthesizing protein A|tara:strand:+ start:85899 stop:86198 length:300 start_codon:yes stop_codon:yes gene_type:complete
MTDPVPDPAQDENAAERELLLDVMGQQCPLPVLRARKRLLNLEPGTLLRVFVTDPVSRVDMPHFCQDTGHELVETRDRGTWIEFLIRRGQTIKQDDPAK